MRPARRARLVPATLLVAALLAGCGPGPAPVPPAPPANAGRGPEPTYVCAPNRGTPSPCSAEEYTRVEKQKVDEAEAVQVYRRFFNESSRLWRAGGTDKATSELRATTGGEYQKAQVAQFSQLKASGTAAKGGSFKLAKNRPTTGAAERGFDVALSVCIDARSVELESASGTTNGIAYAETAYLKRQSGGTLRIVAAVGKKVSRC